MPPAFPVVRHRSRPTQRSTMFLSPVCQLLIAVVGLTLALPARNISAAEGATGEIDFNRDIRPILASHCFKCHGPDEGTREAGLRLDTAEGAAEDLGGYQAVVRGDPTASELIVRVRHEDPDLRMPPADGPHPLDDAQIELLERWVKAGGQFSSHWAFEPPQLVSPPLNDATAITADSWSRDAIDSFVRRRLGEQELAPNVSADRLTLVRRVYLDLTGLPPTPAEADRFLQDESPMAYAKLVDRLLADPANAERQARVWMDLAHYADTNGYEKDRPRTIWPYRDWVIDALAADMPFDQFTIEQLAGDMLPNPTRSQRIATGFLRNTMLNEEGGIDPLEFRYLAMVDRVHTVGTVWLGMTTGCAQCHTHKYDPITHTDYFALMALLNNADEPEVVVADQEAARLRAQYDQELDSLYAALKDQFGPEPFEPALQAWIATQQAALVDWQVPQPSELASTLPKLRWQEDGSIFADGDATKRDEYRLVYDASLGDVELNAIRLEVLPDPRLPAGGPGRSYYEGRRGDFFLSELRVLVDGQPVELRDPSHSHGSLSIGSGGAAAANVIDGDASTGWSTSSRPGQPNRWVANLAKPIPAGAKVEVSMLFERHFAASLGRFRLAFAKVAEPIAAAPLPAELQTRLLADEPIEGEFYEQLSRAFMRDLPQLAEARKPLEAKLNARPQPTSTLVLRERADDNQRLTFRHHRGEYLQPKEKVEGAIPEVLRRYLSDRFGDSGPSNRLEFAQWLASSDNPLVARVTANRVWRTMFGSGLVRTAGDFGTQSEPPVYPQVLDHLAIDFMETGWSLKRLQRRIVMSSVYQQSSHADAARRNQDLDNRLLSRGPRFRVDAEMIRDAALVASGRLSAELGGPSVYPPQPASVTGMAYGSPAWKTSPDGDRYRRSLYTFAKRTAPFAAYTVFDGPTGESCLPRRDRSNTPLQSLTLLNDPMLLELASATANKALRDVGGAGTDVGAGGDSQLVADEEDHSQRTAAIAETIFRRVLTRQPTAVELEQICAFYEQQLATNSGPREPADELAGWTLVARALMNTDEAITKE